ncbi:hypothetical protein [Halpernia sp. GG3]
MRKNYLIHGLVIASSLTLLNGCQHLNNSYSKSNRKLVPIEKETKMIANGQAMNISNSSEEEGEGDDDTQTTKIAEHSREEKSDFKNIFKNLADNDKQAEVRKEFLMTLSKPGEKTCLEMLQTRENRRLKVNWQVKKPVLKKCLNTEDKLQCRLVLLHCYIKMDI